MTGEWKPVRSNERRYLVTGGRFRDAKNRKLVTRARARELVFTHHASCRVSASHAQRTRTLVRGDSARCGVKRLHRGNTWRCWPVFTLPCRKCRSSYWTYESMCRWSPEKIPRFFLRAINPFNGNNEPRTRESSAVNSSSAGYTLYDTRTVHYESGENKILSLFS